MDEKKQIENIQNEMEMWDDDQNAVESLAEHLYNAGYRKQSEWISVDERLPDGNGRFLTVDEKGDMMVCYWENHFGWFASVCNKNAITHWMPLPEPPKMRKEDEEK